MQQVEVPTLAYVVGQFTEMNMKTVYYMLQATNKRRERSNILKRSDLGVNQTSALLQWEDGGSECSLFVFDSNVLSSGFWGGLWLQGRNSAECFVVYWICPLQGSKRDESMLHSETSNLFHISKFSNYMSWYKIHCCNMETLLHHSWYSKLMLVFWNVSSELPQEITDVQVSFVPNLCV